MRLYYTTWITIFRGLVTDNVKGVRGVRFTMIFYE